MRILIFKTKTTIMRILIQAIDFDADKKLISIIKGKIEKITKFADKIISIEVHLKLDNTRHIQKDKIVLINVRVPGYNYIVRSKPGCKIFEKSFNEAYESLINSIKKRATRSKKRKNKYALAA